MIQCQFIDTNRERANCRFRCTFHQHTLFRRAFQLPLPLPRIIKGNRILAGKMVKTRDSYSLFPSKLL